MTFIYNRAFGEPAPDYLMRLAEGWTQEHGLRRLDALDTLLQSTEFRSAIKRIFEAAADWSPSNDVLFEAGIIAATKGREEAERFASARAASERREIENLWRNEVLAELPETFEQLIDEAGSDPETGSLGISNQLFEAMGALSECSICGEAIVDVDAFVEAVLDHYGMEEDPGGSLAIVLMNAGYETGDWDHPRLCGYHAYQLSKD